MNRKRVIAIATCALTLAASGCGRAPEVKTVEQPQQGAAAQPAKQGKAATGGKYTQEEAGIKYRADLPEIKQFLGISKPGPVIPALLQDAIPQGIGFIREKNWTIISHYRDDKKPSFLSVIDNANGSLVKTMDLYHNAGTPYTGHAGGVTVSAKHVWVSSDQMLYQLKLEDVINSADQAKLTFTGEIKTETRASFAAYADGILWAGEFAHGTDYPTSKTHYFNNREGAEHKAWAVGYRLDAHSDGLPAGKTNESGPVTPDYILSIPDSIQGMDATNKRIVLSQSYGRNNASTLLKYGNPLGEKPHAMAKIGNVQVPLWFLDGKNRTDQLEVPPMAEGIIDIDGTLHLLFESGAAKYKSSGKYPLDRVQLIDWK